MNRVLSNYRLWLWQGRFLGIVTLFESVSGRDFTEHFIVTAMAYGLAQYFKERP